MGCAGSKPELSTRNEARGDCKQSILPPVIPVIKITGAEKVSFLPSPGIKVVFMFGELLHNNKHLVKMYHEQ